MLDAPVRKLIDPLLTRLAAPIAAAGVAADTVTVAGFGMGLLAVPLLAAEFYGAALIAIFANRLCDGLDGAVARRTTMTDFGGYLDIVLDFIFYAAVAFGFALARSEYAVAAAFLILSFVGTGSSFLAFAVIAAKRQLTTDLRGRKSLYYLGGLTEGTETIAVFVALCLFPDAFAGIAYAFGALCWLTTIARVVAARRAFAG